MRASTSWTVDSLTYILLLTTGQKTPHIDHQLQLKKYQLKKYPCRWGAQKIFGQVAEHKKNKYQIHEMVKSSFFQIGMKTKEKDAGTLTLRVMQLTSKLLTVPFFTLTAFSLIHCSSHMLFTVRMFLMMTFFQNSWRICSICGLKLAVNGSTVIRLKWKAGRFAFSVSIKYLFKTSSHIFPLIFVAGFP